MVLLLLNQCLLLLVLRRGSVVVVVESMFFVAPIGLGNTVLGPCLCVLLVLQSSS